MEKAIKIGGYIKEEMRRKERWKRKREGLRTGSENEELERT